MSAVATVGVVPAAGFGTRLGLAAGSKELVEVGGRPVAAYLVDRMRAAACDEIRLVTRGDKSDLRAWAAAEGLREVLATPPHVGASLAAGIAGLDAGDVVLFGFPDSIWEPEDGFARLVAGLEDGADAVLGLFTTADAARSDVVTLSADGRLAAIDVKPERPSSNLIWGCLAARAGVLTGVERSVEPSDHLVAVAADRRVDGVFLSHEWIDVGSPEALARARHAAAAPTPRAS